MVMIGGSQEPTHKNYNQPLFNKDDCCAFYTKTISGEKQSFKKGARATSCPHAK